MDGDWWDELLQRYAADGKRDAEKGEFHPPRPNSDNSQDQEENFAYSEGFHRRRRELGGAFLWAE